MTDLWLETIARPASHLVATSAVFTVLIACVVLSVPNPARTSLFGVVGAVPVVGWYLFMMKRYPTEPSAPVSEDRASRVAVAGEWAGSRLTRRCPRRGEQFGDQRPEFRVRKGP